MRYLTLVVFLFSAVCGCAHLKIKPEETPAFEERVQLNVLLSEVSYPEHKYDVYDCSNMSAYLYDFLTARGYRCVLYLGALNPGQLIFGDAYGDHGHAWLSAEKNGKIFFVESTIKIVMPPDWYDHYSLRLRFDSLDAVKKFWKRTGLSLFFKNEWEY